MDDSHVSNVTNRICAETSSVQETDKYLVIPASRDNSRTFFVSIKKKVLLLYLEAGMRAWEKYQDRVYKY